MARAALGLPAQGSAPVVTVTVSHRGFFIPDPQFLHLEGQDGT